MSLTGPPPELRFHIAMLKTVTASRARVTKMPKSKRRDSHGMPRLVHGFPPDGLSGLGGFDGSEFRGSGGVDGDLAGLFLLRHNALQVNMEQAVLKPRGAHLDMLRSEEHTSELQSPCN